MENQLKKILLIGSGNVSESIINYYKKFPYYQLTLASNDLKQAQELTKKYNHVYKTLYLNVKDSQSTQAIIKQNDLVISMVPASFHEYILKFCVKEKVHFVCASYLSEKFKSYNEQAIQNNVTCLFELGLDPGIDHIVTFHIIEKIRKRQGKINKLLSLCGGLTAPEYINNPISYKFSWSPEGVFKAIADCKYLENGQVKEIEEKDLLYNAKEVNINKSLNTVYYPNRDSVKYRDLYQIPEVQSLLRGSIRFGGFVEIVQAFYDLGLLDQTDLKLESHKTLNGVELLECQVRKSCCKIDLCYEKVSLILQKIYENVSKDLINKIIVKITNNQFWQTLTQIQKEKRLLKVFDGLHYFDLLNRTKTFTLKNNMLSGFVQHLIKYLSLQGNETDFVIMMIIFDVVYPDGGKEQITFKLLKSGDKNGLTAMCQLVGLPCAIASRLILENQLSFHGVVGPFHSEIYNIMYEELISNKIIEKIRRKEMVPKL